MSKLLTMREAIADLVPDGASVALGLQMEQMIPFAAGHEIIRQNKRGLTLIGPISDILFDQMIAAGCVERVIAAWVGNVMMGSAYNFRRAVEQGRVKVVNLSNFAVALALQAAAMGVPFLPTLTALGSDLARNNDFFAEIESPFVEADSGESAAAYRSSTAPESTMARWNCSTRARARWNASRRGLVMVVVRNSVSSCPRTRVVAAQIPRPRARTAPPPGLCSAHAVGRPCAACNRSQWPRRPARHGRPAASP